MQAADAIRLCGGDWTEWQPLERAFLKRVPRKPGTYLIRARRALPRMNKRSDIVYVGKGILSTRIGNCLACNEDLRWWPSYSEALCRVINELKLPLDFSYTIAHSKEDAQSLEEQILESYEQEHFELPPLNLVRARRSG